MQREVDGCESDLKQVFSYCAKVVKNFKTGDGDRFFTSLLSMSSAVNPWYVAKVCYVVYIT